MVSIMQADAIDYGPAESRYFTTDSKIYRGQIQNPNADFNGVTKNAARIVKDIMTGPFGPFITMGPLKVATYQEPQADCIKFVRELEHRLCP